MIGSRAAQRVLIKLESEGEAVIGNRLGVWRGPATN